MTPAEWRALLEAYVQHRLGADAFCRRFMEGWRANRRSGAPSPRVIDDLQIVVEAFESDPARREDQGADEGELEQAAARALAVLRKARDEGPLGPRTYDRARAREDIRRFQVRINQTVGLGCFIALAWIGLCVLQISAVAEQIHGVFGWSAAPATFVSVPLAFVPVVGNVLAFFGATEAWGWNHWIAAVVFFAAPAATLLSAWMRWWRN
ncbi:MAG: colicin immunity domain-containing protein [Hyphomonadaceae bacterium]